MRLNLALLEAAADVRIWRQGRTLFQEAGVTRLARGEGVDGRPIWEVRVLDDGDRYEVELGLDSGGVQAVLEEWACSCADRDNTCPHSVAAALGVREVVERAGTGQTVTGDNWRDALEGETPSDAPVRMSWICYDLTLSEGKNETVVGIVRRRRSENAKGRRTAGGSIGWKPTAVGHFGYRTGDDPAQNRDDLIPVLCLVNRHDLRVRTIQPGFIDVFFRLFVDAETFTLRIDGEDARVDGSERALVVIIDDAADGGLIVSAQLTSHVPGQAAVEHVLLPGPVAWVYLRGERCVVRPSSNSHAALKLLRSGAQHIPLAEVDAFCRELLPVLRADVEVIERSAQLPPVAVAEGRAIVKLNEVEGALLVALGFAYDTGAYGEVEMEAQAGARVFRAGTTRAGREILWTRDQDFEEHWVRRVSMAIAGALPARLGIDEALDFLVDVIPQLQAEGAEIRGQKELEKILPAEAPVEAVVRVSSGIDWFGLRVAFQTGSQQVNTDSVINAWRSGVRHVELSDGRLARLPSAWLKRNLGALTDLRELAAPDPDDPDAWRVQPFLLPTVASLAEGETAADARWSEFLARIGRFEKIAERPLPEGLNAELRGYQHHGYDWISALRDLRLNGCLADDMGLGKTVQTLALLLFEKQAGRGDRPTLVVAPTSVVSNWAAEAARFTPQLEVMVLRADDRAARVEQLAHTEGVDILVTSYALVRQDLERLQALPLHYLILDEAQAIKNPASKTARAACALNSRHRLTLTGTPLENNLLELWSQMHFLQPGFFGPRGRFVRRYGAVRSAATSPQAMAQLRARLRPFVLRRLKRDVDKELPPITEVVLRCELGTDQRRLYTRVRESMRAKVLKLVDDVGIERASLGVLEALLRLRQACCHPRLLPFDEARAVADSAKTSLFMRTLQELLSEGAVCWSSASGPRCWASSAPSSRSVTSATATWTVRPATAQMSSTASRTRRARRSS